MLSPVKIWRNQKKVAALLGRRGKIVSWTIIRVPPGNFSSLAPYPVVLLELADKTFFTCQLVDYGDRHLRADQPVALVLRRVYETSDDGIIPYGIKAKPL